MAGDQGAREENRPCMMLSFPAAWWHCLQTRMTFLARAVSVGWKPGALAGSSVLVRGSRH